MSEATEPIDHADVDVFGASTYTAIARQGSSQGINSYKIPLGSTGFFKTIKLLTTNYTKNLYIRTERNMMEYTDVQILYGFIKPGTDAEVSYLESISGSVVNGMTHKPSSQNERFERDFPGGVITPDQFVGNVSSSKNEDAVLRTIFNAPNIIKRISPSGSRSTYHLHKYAISGGNFQAIYKRGKAPA